MPRIKSYKNFYKNEIDEYLQKISKENELYINSTQIGPEQTVLIGSFSDNKTKNKKNYKKMKELKKEILNKFPLIEFALLRDNNLYGPNKIEYCYILEVHIPLPY